MSRPPTQALTLLDIYSEGEKEGAEERGRDKNKVGIGKKYKKDAKSLKSSNNKKKTRGKDS